MVMRDRFNAQDSRFAVVPLHSQTAGVSLFAEQPRTTLCAPPYQACPRCLAGPVAAHQQSWTRRWRCPPRSPCDRAAHAADLAHESGVPNTVDPLGGSYASSADRLMERGCFEYSAYRRVRRHAGGDRKRLSAARNRRFGVPLPAGGRHPPRILVGVNDLSRATRADSDPHPRPAVKVRSATWSAAAGPPRA